MSARDDYPLARLDKTNYVGIGADQTLDVQARRALDEIDRLRLNAAHDTAKHEEERLALVADLDNLRMMVEHYVAWFGSDCRCDQGENCPL